MFCGIVLLSVATASALSPESSVSVLPRRPNTLLMSLMKKSRKLIDVDKLDEDDLEKLMRQPESIFGDLQASSPFQELGASPTTLSASPTTLSDEPMTLGAINPEINDDSLEIEKDDWWSQGW
jgi:hypothetical protein